MVIIMCTESVERDMRLVKYNVEKIYRVEVRPNGHVVALSHVRMRLRTRIRGPSEGV